MKPRKLLRKLAEGLLLLLITALLTEGAFRAVHAVHPIYIFPTATYNRFRSPPGTIFYGHAVNSDGFLDAEVEHRKPPGTFRVAGIGDSFVFGVVPYPDNFLTVLETDLRQLDRSIEVVNMGIPNADPGDYLLLLRKEALALDPDLVIVHFFIGNDFTIRRRYSSAPRSYLEAFLRYVFGIRPDFTRPQMREYDDYDDTAPTMHLPRYVKILHRRIALFRKKDAAFRQQLPQVTATLKEIRDVCRDAGIPLFVVVLPEEMQVSWEARRQAIEALPGYKPRRYDYEMPNRAIHRVLRELEIAFLDLYPTFRRAGVDEVLYKPRDTHWNIRGNRLAADAIRQALTAGEWLPPAARRPPEPAAAPDPDG